MSKKNLILVIGRSGSGKDTLVRRAMIPFNAISVPSYTDRPIRPTEVNGREHTFLTKEQFDEVMRTEKVFAYTKIGETGYRYCTTVEMLSRFPEENIFYIIDPKGFYFCQKFVNEFNMKCIYVTADDEVRKARANSRNGDTTAWEKRNKDEDEQFTLFELEKRWDGMVINNGSLDEALEEFIRCTSKILNPNVGAKKITRPTFLISFNGLLEEKYIEIYGGAKNAKGIHYFDAESFFSVMERLDKAFLNEQEFCVWDPDEDSFVKTTFSKFKTATDTSKYYVKEYV